MVALLQSLPPQVALLATPCSRFSAKNAGKCHIRDKPAGGLSVDQQAQLLEGASAAPHRAQKIAKPLS